MSSNEVNLVDILKDAHKKFVKEVQKSDDDDNQSLSNIGRYLEVFQCCLTGLVLTIDTSKTSTAAALSESMHIIDLRKYFGNFSDINAIASNKDIPSTLKKLSKLKKGSTISDEIKRIGEIILSQFNEYTKPYLEESVKISFPVTPSKSSRNLRKSRLSSSSQVPFGRVFDQFAMFVSSLYKLYSDIDPRSLDSLSGCVKAFIDACRSGKFVSDARGGIAKEVDNITKMINNVVDELVMRLSDDGGENDDYTKEIPVNSDPELIDSELGTDSLSAEMSRGSRDSCGSSPGNQNPNESGIKIEGFIDYSSYNGKRKCEKLANDLLADPKKLNDITDVDTLRSIITGLMQMVRENDAMCSCKYRGRMDPFYGDECDSICSDGTILAVVVPRGFSFPELSKKCKKKSSKKSKKVHLKSTPDDYPDSGNGAVLTNTNTDDQPLASSSSSSNSTALTNSDMFENDNNFKKLSLRTKSTSEIINPGNGKTLRKVSSRGTHNTFTRSTFLEKIKYDSDRFFRLDPRIVNSLVDGSNQRGGVEFLCASLYSHAMGKFVSTRITSQPKYGASLETVFSHHSGVISEFYNLIHHTFMSVYEISAVLSLKDSTQVISMANDIQKNLSVVADLLSNFYLEVMNECLEANWVKYPTDISTEMKNILGGIRNNRFFDVYSWYDKYSSKVRRSQWAREHIIKRFKEQIMSNISRMCNMLTFFSLSISNLPSCNNRFTLGALYEAVAWGISFTALVREIDVKYDAIAKLLAEPDSPAPPMLSICTTTAERIACLRKSANVNELTLYRELEIEPEIMKNKIYEFGEDGMPKRVSLNKLVAIATDPRAPALVREKVGDTIVFSSLLLEKSYAAVLASLMDRFCVPESFIEEYGDEYVSEIKRNTVDLVKRWVGAQIDGLDEPLLNVLEVFINNDIMACYGPEAKSLGEVVYRCKFERDKALEISVLPSIRGFDLDYNEYSFLDIFEGYGGKRIADQMTLATFRLFRKIKINEFCYKSLGSDYYEYEFHNLNRFICHQNYITSIIGLYVASKATAYEREHARKRVLDVMNYLRENNDFSDLFSLYLAYENLYEDEKHDDAPVIKECKDMFDLKSFSKYKKEFDKAPEPKIPLVIDFVKQSILSHEKKELIEPADMTSFSQELRDVGQLDFEDIRKKCESIGSMWSVRNGVYKIALNPSLYKIFYDPPRFVIGSEIDFWNLRKRKAAKAKFLSKTMRLAK